MAEENRNVNRFKYRSRCSRKGHYMNRYEYNKGQKDTKIGSVVCRVALAFADAGR